MTDVSRLTDTRISIETPEGADLPLHPAGVGVRIVAFLIDRLIKTGITIAASIVFSFAGGVGTGLTLIAVFLLEWFYPVYFEVAKQGQTPGKKNVGIVVVNDDGTPVTFTASLLRNLLRVVDFLPFAYLTGVITSINHSKFKRIGDIAAGTMVVYGHEKIPPLNIDVDSKRPVPHGLSTDEQRVLLSFAERCESLSQERQQELAKIIAPVLGTENPVKTIKQIAKTLVGGS